MAAPQQVMMAFPSGSTLNNGIVAYYKLENTNDALSTYNLTNTGTVTFGTPGKISNAAQFTGSNTKRLSTGSSMGLSTSGAFTFNLWVYITSFGSDYILDFETTTTANRRFIIYQNSSSSCEVLFSYNAIGSGTLSTSTWYMFTLRYSGTGTNQCEFFVDAVSKGTVTTGTSAGGSRNNFSLGNAMDSLGSEMSGAIDECGVWNRALTNAEITSLYASGSPGASQQYPFS